jgi:hypothetical protein
MSKRIEYLRLFRQSVDKLPVTYKKMTVQKIVSGEELIRKGIKELKDGKPIMPRFNYTSTGIEDVPVNHYNELKKIYDANYTKGDLLLNQAIAAYCDACNGIGKDKKEVRGE